MDYQVLGVVMIAPTLFVALMITYKTRRAITELFHNLAVCLWIMANSVWMIGEFFYDDTSRRYATVFFVSGLLVMSYYYLFLQRRPAKRVLARVDEKAVVEKAVVLEPIE